MLLTEDWALIGPRVETQGTLPVTAPDESGSRYPAGALGWVSYVGSSGPRVCWPRNGTQVCDDITGKPIDPQRPVPADSRALQPQLGFEVQKFAVFYAYEFLPSSLKMDWVDMMRIYQVGREQDPDYLPAQSVVWRDPVSGLRYVARRYGNEVLLGKSYDKGIAAKMLQWANVLTSQAFEPQNASQPFDPATGMFVYKVDGSGQPILVGSARCDESRACTALRNYRGLIDYMRDTAARLGFPEPALNGIYQ